MPSQAEPTSIEIPVEAIGTAAAATGGALPALLHEITAMLETLIASGESNSMDLRRAPLDAAERRELRSLLGRGDVSATIDLLGPTEVYETATAGIWWVTHLNPAGDAIGEFIEVARIPELLESQSADMQSGLKKLRTKLSERSQQVDTALVARSVSALGLQSCVLTDADQEPENGHSAHANQLNNGSPDDAR